MSEDINDQPEKELSEEELDQVAGGGAEPHLSPQGSRQSQIGTFSQGVTVAVGDVNGDALTKIGAGTL